MPDPTKLPATERACLWSFNGHLQDQNIAAPAGQSCNSKPQYDGRSFKMRGFEQVRKSLTVAGLMLVLLLVGIGSMSAQLVPTPVPWPQPAAVPPPPAVIPAFQTVPVAFDVTGMIQYASLDPAPGLCL